ncbi:LysE family translocator [Marinovum sp.]|uniref:LysE family translocator n=1 Tax=Marinovum sp. TaxID=2024839 RepID=UPI002B27278B|nr:LysE family translocator [Marinovum sp.]
MDISLLAFGLVAFATVATPGPTVLLALSNGSRFGMMRAGAGIVGAGLSDLVLMTAAAAGLGAILATSAFWFSVVKWIGAIYLAWLGIQMLRSSAAPGNATKGTTTASTEGAPLRLFRKSFLVAATNPKGYLFFAAFLPQFVDPGEPLFGQYATLAVIFVAIDLAVMTAYAALGVNTMRFIRERGALLLERSCGVVMLSLAGGLALYKRT